MGFIRSLDAVFEAVDRRDFLRTAVATAASAAAPGVASVSASAGGAGGVVQSIISDLWGNADFLAHVVHEFGDRHVIELLKSGNAILADFIDKPRATDVYYVNPASSNYIWQMVSRAVGLDDKNFNDRDLIARARSVLDEVIKTPVRKHQFLSALVNNPDELFRIYMSAVSEHNDSMNGINELYGGFFERFERELIDKVGPENFLRVFFSKYHPHRNDRLLEYMKHALKDLGARHRGIMELFPNEIFKPGSERDLFRVLTRRGLVDREQAETIARRIDFDEYARKSWDRGIKADEKKRAEKAKRDADELNAEVSRWEGEGGSVLEARIARRLIGRS